MPKHTSTHTKNIGLFNEIFNKIQNVCDIFFTCGLTFVHPVVETQI